VKESLEETLTRLLTPRQSVDVVREVMAAKEAGRPYSIVFVGVNGVGKSTTLSKVPTVACATDTPPQICWWLMHHNLKVMICACDTFRSAAIEQLRVHSERLGAPLFARGYNSDPASVAMDGIRAGAQARTRGW
jgi:signal recognition particle receptor subunit alpha